MIKKDKYQIMGGIAFMLLGINNLIFSFIQFVNGQKVNDFLGSYFWAGAGLFILGFALLMIGVLFLASDTEKKTQKCEKESK